MTPEQHSHQQDRQSHNYGDMPVGEILRRTRVYYGLSLEQLQSVLYIRTSYLEAIENGDLRSLPGRTYAIGFVRTYAEYLQLDAERVVCLFKNQYVGNNNRPELYFPATASESKLPNKYILSSSIAALMALIIGWSFVSGGQGGLKSSVPAVPDDLKIEITGRQIIDPSLDGAVLNAIAPAAGEMKMSAEDTAEKKITAEDAISIHMTDSVWIEVRRKEDNHIHVSRVFEAGDVYKVPQEEGLVMDTGNAGALEIHIGDDVLPSLGATGDIMREVSLSNESLMQKFTQEPDTIIPDNELSGLSSEE